MPRPKWKPPENLTPFARVVREWLWHQEPPMSVPQLADRTSISKQAIWSWFQRDAMPRRDTVIQFARATGLDVDMLLRAAGLPDTRVNDAERQLQIQTARLIMKRIVAELDMDTHILDNDRQAFKSWLFAHAPHIVKDIQTAEDVVDELTDDPLKREGDESDRSA